MIASQRRCGLSTPTTQTAAELLRRGKRDEARRLLGLILRADPHDTAAWLCYAETWRVIGNKLKVLRVGASLNPGSPDIQRAISTISGQLTALGGPGNRQRSFAIPRAPAPMAFTASSVRSRPRSALSIEFLPLFMAIPFIGTALFLILSLVRMAETSRTPLAIGDAAKVEQINVSIQSPADLDYKTKAEVLQLRTEAVLRYPQLLSGSYEPSREVFGQIEDNRPWWGLIGLYLGPGERSIEGDSEESRFLLNPYLLIGASGSGSWDPTSSYSRFALYCPPRSLSWKPRIAYAEVTYPVQCRSPLSYWEFDLVAYNARDFGLRYLLVSYNDSRNVAKTDPPTTPIAIPQFIHRGGSCGYPGGCNNMSPATPAIQGLKIRAMPAELVVLLWDDKPTSAEQPAGMTFVIHFR